MDFVAPQDLLRRLSQCSQDDLVAARAEVQRTRGILSDATSTLTKSFLELIADSNTQRELVLGLLATVDKANDKANGGDRAKGLGIDGFIVETTATLKTATAALRQIAADTKAGLNRTEPMLAQFDHVTRILVKLDNLVEQSRILALNGRIEASRAGGTGAAFAVVATAMRDFAGYCGGLKDEIGDQVGHTRELLEQMRTELAQATDGGVAAAAQAERRAEHLVLQLEGLRTSLERELARLDQLSNRIKDNIGAAVRALQFADMVDQLLVSIDRRISRVEANVALGDAGLSGETGEEALRDRVAQLGELTGICPVEQSSVSEGSIELF